MSEFFANLPGYCCAFQVTTDLFEIRSSIECDYHTGRTGRTRGTRGSIHQSLLVPSGDDSTLDMSEARTDSGDPQIQRNLKIRLD